MYYWPSPIILTLGWIYILWLKWLGRLIRKLILIPGVFISYLHLEKKKKELRWEVSDINTVSIFCGLRAEWCWEDAVRLQLSNVGWPYVTCSTFGMWGCQSIRPAIGWTYCRLDLHMVGPSGTENEHFKQDNIRLQFFESSL